MSIRTRFAPSPTGYVHVGSLRAALFPYLFAKKNGGAFILRIEDTDQERLVEGAVENLLRVLAWAGITPDEGPAFLPDGTIKQKGEYGPYVQSERLAIYTKHVQTLLENGSAYYAFDTSEELTAMRERQEAMKHPPKYERHTMKNQYTLGEAETKRLIAEKVPSVIRLKVPENQTVEFTDLIRGRVKVSTSEIDDQVLMKSDGFPTYHLAVVVDDHLMAITHVIRGEDWLPSTPKHILLYQAFGWTIPEHAHMPLLVDAQKQKLSKRKGDVSVESYKEKGYLADAFVNFLAFLGWNPGDNREIMTVAEITTAFDISKVQKSSAFFNLEKLDWYNQQYIRAMPLEDLTRLAGPYLEQANLTVSSEMLPKALGLIKERVSKFLDIPEMIKFLVDDALTYDPEILIWKKSTREGSKEKLVETEKFLNTIDVQDWQKTVIEQKVGEWIAANGYGVGDVLWPLRVALSGQKNSPGPYEIADVLGKEKTLTRVQKAISSL